ncbi:hypothetical protein [Lentibacillus sp. CBA3610]|uniref:hypothetical protein n=1 Tax=Lentibacillus sp. CBA3610 TaxID=2518176 RepID=UPI001595704D|nr:hypothetical protein [Lentibacillus sp. CBA3610]QKY68460.1 hypothetical protein Len3610_01455 [Lentibacillus sp. CBA3610]
MTATLLERRTSNKVVVMAHGYPAIAMDMGCWVNIYETKRLQHIYGRLHADTVQAAVTTSVSAGMTPGLLGLIDQIIERYGADTEIHLHVFQWSRLLV